MHQSPPPYYGVHECMAPPETRDSRSILWRSEIALSTYESSTPSKVNFIFLHRLVKKHLFRLLRRWRFWFSCIIRMLRCNIRPCKATLIWTIIVRSRLHHHANDTIIIIIFTCGDFWRDAIKILDTLASLHIDINSEVNTRFRAVFHASFAAAVIAKMRILKTPFCCLRRILADEFYASRYW